MTWECGVDGCTEVRTERMAVLQHTYYTSDDVHGDEGDVPAMPVESNQTPTGQTVGEEMAAHMSSEFEGNEELFQELVEDDEFEFPQVLTDQDLDHFELMRNKQALEKDIQALMEMQSDIERVFNKMVDNPEPLGVDTSTTTSTSSETTEDTSGSYTSGDLREQEYEGVRHLVQQTDMFNGMHEDTEDVFLYIYQNRTDTEPPTVDDIVRNVQVSKGEARDILDKLDKRGFVHRTQDDEFYYPETELVS